MVKWDENVCLSDISMNTLTILIQVLRRRIFGSRFPGAEKREGLMRDMFCVSFQMFPELLSQIILCLWFTQILMYFR